MEVRCPSCSAQHRSEDYPGAFDILCGCGYLILNPELSSDAENYNQVNFEGAPATSEDSKILVEAETAKVEAAPFSLEETPSFDTGKLTPPEELPSGMLYDPTEVPATTPAEEQKEKVEANPETNQTLVERIQSASMGQVLGPDYDLEFSELDHASRLKAQERVQKFLQDHKWLLEIMERRSFLLQNIFQNDRLEKVPEALAVEIYISCLENGGQCRFYKHTDVFHKNI